MQLIKESAARFIHALQQKPSLSPLYEKKALVIEIQSPEDPFWLVISNEGHFLLDQAPLDTITLILMATSRNMMEAVLVGKRPLLRVKEEGHLTIQGPFNDQLTLESLLILSSQHSFLVV